MKNKEIHLNKKYIVLATMLLLFAVLVLIHYLGLRQKQKEYMEAGGEIVVVFKEEIGTDELYFLTKTYGTSVTIVRHIADYALLYIEEVSEFDRVLKNIKNNPQVEAVQANQAIRSLSISDDAYAETQWAIDNPGYYTYLTKDGSREMRSIKDVDMDVVEAWQTFKEMSPKPREVVVAIIDTGVDYAHPDLAEHMWINENEIDGDKKDNDNNGYIDDIYGWDFYNEDASVCHYEYSKEYKANIALTEDNDNHGTHIAGIIGAVANNNIGIAGVASNVDVKIMALKINGGSDGSGNISGAIEAIKYATNMGADICNLSWGTSVYSEPLEQIMKESDMLFVAAAGNSGDDNNENQIYPANLKLDNLISVTFVDPSGELTNLSNYGENTVDLAAPGENIYSTVVGRYEFMSGSSMAAPQVCAVAAILYAYNDHLYPANVKEIIVNNIKHLPSLSGRMKNAGIPSAFEAVKASNKLIQDRVPPVFSFETMYNKGEMIISVYADDKGTSETRAVKWISGNRNSKDFARGVKGTTVEKNQITISKAGTYTFYAADYAGNEAITTYQVLEDTTEPKLSTNYTVTDSYKSRTVTVIVSDLQSGVNRVKYMAGSKVAKDFLPAQAGTKVELKNDKGTFKVKQDGIYTIFASDNRGNLSVKRIMIKTIKATKIKLILSQKTLNIGEKYTLKSYVMPIGTTDKVTYVSTNKTVATISSTGKIVALSNGTTDITAKTSSGLTAVCKVTVEAQLLE